MATANNRRPVSSWGRWTTAARRRAKTDGGAARPNDPPEVAALLESDEFRSATQTLADQLGRDHELIGSEAAGYIREMAASHNPVVLGTWHRIAAWLVRG